MNSVLVAIIAIARQRAAALTTACLNEGACSSGAALLHRDETAPVRSVVRARRRGDACAHENELELHPVRRIAADHFTCFTRGQPYFETRIRRRPGGARISLLSVRRRCATPPQVPASPSSCRALRIGKGSLVAGMTRDWIWATITSLIVGFGCQSKNVINTLLISRIRSLRIAGSKPTDYRSTR
jgi:hypothetical protein